MATKPTTDITFSTSGTNNVEPSGFRVDGYPDGFPPPSKMHNWQFSEIGEHIDYLEKSAGQFQELSDAAAALTDGDSCIINSMLDSVSNSPVAPFSIKESFVTPETNVASIDSDGQYVLLAINTAGDAPGS